MNILELLEAVFIVFVALFIAGWVIYSFISFVKLVIGYIKLMRGPKD